MVSHVCGWNGMKINVIWIQDYIGLWVWDHEYIIFKDIETIQKTGAIWGGKED